MRRSQRHLLIVATVATVLGVAVWQQVRHEQSQWPEPLTALAPQAIQQIELNCPAQACVHQRFERVDDEWWMREPTNRLADPKRIEGLLAIAQASVRSRRLLANLDPAKLGLDPAQAILRLDSTTIAFGGFDSIDGDRYARVDDGDQVALVPDRFSPFLFATPQ